MELLKRGTELEGVESSAKVKKDLKFTLDPDMHKKLDIKPRFKGEPYKEIDLEKMYLFQLRRDLDLIQDNTVSYREQVDNFVGNRMQEVTYRNIANARPLGRLGKMNDVAVKRQDQVWRETSMPYSLLAHRYYYYWKKNLPGGPSKEYLNAREQNKIDYSLWDDIRFGRIEPTQEELRNKYLEDKRKAQELAEEEKRLDIEAAKSGKERESEALKAEKKRQEEELNKRATAIRKGNFEELRILPTRSEFARSMDRWDHGHNHEFKGFPLVDGHEEDFRAAGRDIAKDTGDNGTYNRGKKQKLSTEKYIPTDGSGEFLRAFYNWIQDVNAKRCEDYLRKVKRERKAAKRAALRASKEMLKVAAKTKAELEKRESEAKAAEEANPEGLSLLELFWKRVSVDYFINEHDFHAWNGVDVLEFKDKIKKRAEFVNLIKTEYMEEVDHAICPPIELPPIEVDDDDSTVKTEFNENLLVVLYKDYHKRFSFWSSKFKKNAKVYMENNGLSMPKNGDEDGDEDDEEENDDNGTLATGIKSLSSKRSVVSKNSKNSKKSLPALHRGGQVVFPETERAIRYKAYYRAKAKVVWDKIELDIKNNYYAISGQEDKIVLPKIEEEEDDDDDMNSDDDLDEAEDDEKLSLTENNHKRKNDPNKGLIGKAKYYWDEFKYFAKIEERPDKKKQGKRGRNAKFNNQPVEYKLHHGPENSQLMEMLFRVRRYEKSQETKWIRLYNKFISGDEDRDTSEDYTGDKLVAAAKSGNYKRVMDLLEDEESILHANSIDSEGVTPLMAAVSLVIAKESYGASEQEFLTIWQRIKRVFMKKAEDEKLDLVIRLLLHKDADINHMKVEKDPAGDGVGLMHMACAAGSLETVKWLVNKGCKLNQKTTRLHKTPLMFAAGQNHLKLCLWLLANGCQPFINDQDEIGEAPLHYAMSCNSPDLANCLMLYGAINNLRAHGPPPLNEKGAGKTPFEKAQQINNVATSVSVRMFKDPYSTLHKYMDFQDFFYFQQGKYNDYGGFAIGKKSGNDDDDDGHNGAEEDD